MNGKIFVGQQTDSFERYEPKAPVTGVILTLDGETAYKAGDMNGNVWELECPYATQAMADNILAALSGQKYYGFSATKAILPPDAELGDGITVNGTYSMLATTSITAGPGHMADISAPGDSETDEMGGYKLKSLRDEEYKFTGIRSRITKTADEINLRVEELGKSTSEELEKYAESVTRSLGELQSQIDGNIMTWFYSYEPTPNNEPASLWTTDAERIKHLGDVFYIVDNEEKGGQAYRWEYVGGAYRWSLIEDVELAKALADAAKAQDTADKKRRVFTFQPIPPYDVGDLWTQGPNGDLMRCNTARESGSFVEGDWGLASKYTDDSALSTFLTGQYKTDLDSIRTQADQKAETWYQDADPSGSWDAGAKTEHTGDMWYCTGSSDATHYQKFWRWSGSGWQEMTSTPPETVFDRIDGKAQIFISQPKPPYREGDLWFNSDTSDIMTCVKDRLSGNYDAGDWEKRNKYTDDSFASEKYAELDLKIGTIKLEVANGDTKSFLTLKVGETVLSSADIILKGVVTFEGLRDGTTVIDGGWIDTDNLNLTGKITWGDLDSGVQRDINNRGISSDEAKTITKTTIDSVLIESPTIRGANIYGGKFWNTDGDAWLDMDSTASGFIGGLFVRTTRWNETPLFCVYSGDFDYGSIRFKGYDFLGFDNRTSLPRGTWDFSNATVTGIGADYVTEQGTSSGWTYRKWNSGVAECWRTETAYNVAVTNQWGNIYVSNAATFGSKAYPFRFTSAPSVQVSPENANGDWWVATKAGGNASTSPGYQVCRGTQNSSMPCTAHFYVVGRWK